MILEKHQAMPFTCKQKSIISINTSESTKILDQGITYWLFSRRQCLTFHPTLLSPAQLKYAGYHCFEYPGFTQLITSIICQERVSRTDSDVHYSQTDNFLHFSSKFQDGLLTALQSANQWNHIEFKRFQAFITQKIQQSPEISIMLGMSGIS